MRPHVRFEWDEAKRRSNLWRQGIDFAEAVSVFSGPNLTVADDRHDYEEDRFLTWPCLKSQKSLLDRVSTGSGSDLVSDQQAIFLMIPEFYDLTRSLPLPVLTRSKHHPDF